MRRPPEPAGLIRSTWPRGSGGRSIRWASRRLGPGNGPDRGERRAGSRPAGALPAARETPPGSKHAAGSADLTGRAPEPVRHRLEHAVETEFVREPEPVAVRRRRLQTPKPTG